MSEQEETSVSGHQTPSSDDLPEGWLRVGSLDIDAQGIARRPDGKVVFIEGALPFEIVSVNVHRKKNNWEQGVVTDIHHESPQRARPAAPTLACTKAPAAAARCSTWTRQRRWP